MTEDNERKAFEEWARGYWREFSRDAFTPHRGVYDDERLDAAWMSWQAARAHLAPKTEPVATPPPSPEREFLREVARRFADECNALGDAARRYLDTPPREGGGGKP